METENLRYLLSALIQSLATTMVVSFIALLAFPRRSRGDIPNTDFYDLSKKMVVEIGFVFIITIFVNVIILAFLDSLENYLTFVVILVIVLSFLAFLMLIFFLWYYVEKLKKI